MTERGVLWCAVFGYFVSNTYKQFGFSVPVLDDDAYLTLVSSVSSLFNAARFVWSGSLDRVGFKTVYGCLLAIQIVLAFTVTLTDRSRISYATFVSLTMFCIGGHFALFPNILK